MKDFFFLAVLPAVILAAIVSFTPLPQFAGQLGTINPAVNQENIHDTICVPGYTATIRPSTSYTRPLKERLCKQQDCGDTSNYELDHRIALTVGGAPADPNNLWLQPYPEARDKDRLEVILNKKVCNYELTLYQAQSMLKGDWRRYYDKYVAGKFGGTDLPADEDDI